MIDPTFTLDKKTAVVVGAANGIGRATALAFAAAGARVACADVEEGGAKTTAGRHREGRRAGAARPSGRHRRRELSRCCRGDRHAVRRARRPALRGRRQ